MGFRQSDVDDRLKDLLTGEVKASVRGTTSLLSRDENILS